MRKPNSTSVLKTLPDEKQRELFEYLKSHSLRQAVAWLGEQGIVVTSRPVSRFWAWYPLAQSLRTAARMGDAVKEILRESPEVNLDEEQLVRAGQAIFEANALQTQDPKLFVSMRKMRQADRALAIRAESDRAAAREREARIKQKDAQIEQKEREIGLTERRVKVLEAKAAQAVATAQDSRLTSEERAARIREIFER